MVEAAGHEPSASSRAPTWPTAVTHRAADACVLDLGADNLDALRALRGQRRAVGPAVRVVVIGTGPAGGRLAWQAGADGFLVRPFHARDLQAA